MKIKRFILILCLIAFSLTACIIAINENGYRLLPGEDRKHFVAYSDQLDSDFQAISALDDSFLVFEICTNDIEHILERNRFTFIRVWTPYCSSENSKALMNDLQSLSKEYPYAGLKVMLISNSYSLSEIKETVLNARYNLPVYVLSNMCYGSKQGSAMKKLARELDRNRMLGKQEYFSTYFLRDTMLIKASWNIPASEIDSAISRDQYLN